MPAKRSMKPRRRVARRARKPRVGPSSKLYLKPYTYKFQLEPQILQVSTVTPATLTIVDSQVPIQNSADGFSVNAGSNGFANYYDIGLACTHRLDDLSFVASYIGLYDAYKINKVTCHVQYLNNVTTVNGGGLMPTIYMAWDQDSQGVPTSLKQLSGIQGVKLKHFGSDKNNNFSLSYKPTQAVVLANGPVAGPILNQASQVKKATWTDCTDTQIAHYGFKAWLTDVYMPGLPGILNAFRVTWTYDISFRSPIRAT